VIALLVFVVFLVVVGILDLVSLGEVSAWWKIEMTINDTDRVSSIVVSSSAPSISMVAVAGRFFGGFALLASARNDAMVVADYRV
jgi:hypothetical protein